MKTPKGVSGRIAGVWIIALLPLILAASADAITWGEADTEHENVGAMVAYDSAGEVWFQVCSGTLIDPYIFLTAGHCTIFAESYFDALDFRVNFAQNALDFSDPTTYYDVEFVVTHPDYGGPRSNPHDVGVLILKEPVTDRAPATLPEPGLLDRLVKQKKLREGSKEADFVVVGYGGTLYWPPPAYSYDNVRQVAESEYQALLPAWLRMSQNHATGDGGTCYGDSGGPAFWTAPNGDDILVGITSWGDRPCVATGFDYRTDIPETLDFLDDVAELVDEWLATP